MKNKKWLIVLSIFVILIVLVIVVFNVMLMPVDKNSNVVTFNIKSGTSKIDIAKDLKTAGLIKSKYAVLAYMFFKPNLNLQAGSYELDRAYSSKKIINKIAKGEIIEVIPTVRITFKEGYKFTDYAKQISENFNINYDEIIDTCADKEFLKGLINEYWFLTDDILNKSIYYPLEGYLSPDTYEFFQNSSIETIVKKMLDETSKELTPIKEELEESTYSIHEIMTIASIVEKEAVNRQDRQKVSQVIYKRLELNMALGMDVTTYYAVFKDMTEEITGDDLASYNAYNTRNNEFKGLPASAICNPSIESIKATLNPSDTNYVYFVADVKTGNVYFAETTEEFLKYKKEFMN